MTISINNTINTVKNLISVLKELEPILRFLSGNLSLSRGNVRNIKLFIYYFLVVVFLMGMLASIALMLVNLPLFSGSMNTDVAYRISDTARSFMSNLIFTGYLLVLITLNAIFLFSCWHTFKKVIKAITG